MKRHSTRPHNTCTHTIHIRRTFHSYTVPLLNNRSREMFRQIPNNFQQNYPMAATHAITVAILYFGDRFSWCGLSVLLLLLLLPLIFTYKHSHIRTLGSCSVSRSLSLKHHCVPFNYDANVYGQTTNTHTMYACILYIYWSARKRTRQTNEHVRAFCSHKTHRARHKRTN